MINVPYYFLVNQGGMDLANRKKMEEIVNITGGIACNYLNDDAIKTVQSFKCKHGIIIEIPINATPTWFSQLESRLKNITTYNHFDVCMLHYEGLPLVDGNRIYDLVKHYDLANVVGWYDGPGCKTIGPGNLGGIRPDIPVNIKSDFRAPSLYHKDTILQYAALELNVGSALLPWYWFSGYKSRNQKQGTIKLDYSWKVDDYHDAGLEAEHGFLIMAQAMRKPIIGVWLLRGPFDYRGPDYDLYLKMLKWHESGFNQRYPE